MVTAAERSQLNAIARFWSLSAALSMCVKIVLASADAASNGSSSARLILTKTTVRKWRTRFIAQRIQGLHNELRPCALRTIDDEQVAVLINGTLQTRPESVATHCQRSAVCTDPASWNRGGNVCRRRLSSCAQTRRIDDGELVCCNARGPSQAAGPRQPARVEPRRDRAAEGKCAGEGRFPKLTVRGLLK